SPSTVRRRRATAHRTPTASGHCGERLQGARHPAARSGRCPLGTELTQPPSVIGAPSSPPPRPPARAAAPAPASDPARQARDADLAVGPARRARDADLAVGPARQARDADLGAG